MDFTEDLTTGSRYAGEAKNKSKINKFHISSFLPDQTRRQRFESTMSPRKQEKIFEKSYAVELLRIAEGDLQTAETLCHALSAGKSLRTENIFFHAHQVIEKSLKAFLINAEKPVPFVHELGSLVAKISSYQDIPFGYELSQLDAFATIRRYEEGHMALTLDEAVLVVRTASDCLTWVKNYVSV